jgi:endonuclease/exonuclease/phosphatase family metal-dependent hydrolase
MVVGGDPPSFPRRRVQNAVLVRPPRSVRSHQLLRFHEGSLLQPRGALIARLEELSVVSVHLGLAGSERARHVEELFELIDGAQDPIVVGGDLNAHPEDTMPAAIARRYPDAWVGARDGREQGNTFPSDEPVARIDYLFAGPAIRPLRAWTAGDTVSDHLMVIADLELG